METNIKMLLRKLKVDNQPIEIPVKPEKDARTEFCVPNVLTKIKKDGGKIVYGWMIRESKFMIEAIYHAIWESPNGNQIDITIPEIETQRIKFVPDTKTIYRGKQIDNIRINTSENALVDDLIALCELRFKILNYGKRALISGEEIKIPENEYYVLQAIDEYRKYITLLMYEGGNRNSKCFCGSNDKYKHCHGHRLLQKLSSQLPY